MEEARREVKGRMDLKLQWGHGDEAVEEFRSRSSASFWMLLQWGHGDEAVEEDSGAGTKSRGRPRFNGATAMKPWKRT